MRINTESGKTFYTRKKNYDVGNITKKKGRGFKYLRSTKENFIKWVNKRLSVGYKVD